MTSTLGNPFMHRVMLPNLVSPLITRPTTTSTSATLYPLNMSLEEELNRLFTDFRVSHFAVKPTQTNPVWDEFQHNGLDFEYCPDSSDPTDRCNIRTSKKKLKKPLPTECVFCKNNGEEPKVYKAHLLKDEENRIVCPILSAYTCSICGATGQNAHTLKYCPFNKDPAHLAPMNTLKNMRNSTGRRRSSRG